jgi:hypothetical protein
MGLSVNLWKKNLGDISTGTGSQAEKANAALAQVYANDSLGDCVIADIAHVVGVFTGGAGPEPFIYTRDQIITIYSAIGGYNPADPSTDQRCDEQTALNYGKIRVLRQVRTTLLVGSLSMPMIQSYIEQRCGYSTISISALNCPMNGSTRSHQLQGSHGMLRDRPIRIMVTVLSALAIQRLASQ